MDPFALAVFSFVVFSAYIRSLPQRTKKDEVEEKSENVDSNAIPPKLFMNLSVQKHTPISDTNNMLRELSNYMGTDVAHAKMAVDNISRKLKLNSNDHTVRTSMARYLLEEEKQKQMNERNRIPVESITRRQVGSTTIYRDYPLLMAPDPSVYQSSILKARF